ncbi:MAG: AAA family ATPase, partial [Desulfobacula sp.]|nr:AAA family ATPase [Desulfobacula sp.]
MVFIGGPRQVGKTFLSKNILEQAYPSGRYFNWDFTEDQQDLLSLKWHNDDGLIVFDELHKYKNWKNWIKGIFDTNKGPLNFLVTGSA